MIEILMGQIKVRDRQIEQLQRGIDLLQESIRAMKHEVDTQGWPLVPCDPAAIPECYEAVRVGFPRAGEVVADLLYVGAIQFVEDCNDAIYLIIRPIKPPIVLPPSIVPFDWWVTKDENGQVWTHERKPHKNEIAWVNSGKTFKLPPWIAAQLPAEWHELPWDQSAMQQTRGGEG